MCGKLTYGFGGRVLHRPCAVKTKSASVSVRFGIAEIPKLVKQGPTSATDMVLLTSRANNPSLQ